MASFNGAPAQVAPRTRIGTQRSWPTAQAMEWLWGIVSTSMLALPNSAWLSRTGTPWPMMAVLWNTGAA